jgi:Arc/MetJ-type ribon-helix-helix transcriptional regulator
MNLKVTPDQEQLIKDELKTGEFRTAEDVIARALESFKAERRTKAKYASLDNVSVAQQTAVQDMLDFIDKNHVRLSGISVKDLLHEGHRL